MLCYLGTACVLSSAESMLLCCGQWPPPFNFCCIESFQCLGFFMAVDTGPGQLVEGITLSSGILITIFCHPFLALLHHLFLNPFPFHSFCHPKPILPPFLPPHNVKHCILTHKHTHSHTRARILTLCAALLSPSKLVPLSLSLSCIFQWWLLSLSSPGKQRIFVNPGQRKRTGMESRSKRKTHNSEEQATLRFLTVTNQYFHINNRNNYDRQSDL